MLKQKVECTIAIKTMVKNKKTKTILLVFVLSRATSLMRGVSWALREVICWDSCSTTASRGLMSSVLFSLATCDIDTFTTITSAATNTAMRKWQPLKDILVYSKQPTSARTILKAQLHLPLEVYLVLIVLFGSFITALCLLYTYLFSVVRGKHTEVTLGVEYFQGTVTEVCVKEWTIPEQQISDRGVFLEERNRGFPTSRAHVSVYNDLFHFTFPLAWQDHADSCRLADIAI